LRHSYEQIRSNPYGECWNTENRLVLGQVKVNKNQMKYGNSRAAKAPAGYLVV